MKKIITFLAFLITLYFDADGQCLSGIYTIGGTNPNYVTFNSAIDSLKKHGVCGAVLFNIRPGTYKEALSIPQINGTSAVNTITFQSENGDSTAVILSYEAISPTLEVVRLNGVTNLIFHKITLKNESNLNCILTIANATDNITFSNCRLEAPVYASTNPAHALICLNASTCDSLIITDCYFLGGSVGVIAKGTNYASGFVIENNIFINQWHKGIEIWSLSAARVINNNISTTWVNSEYVGISTYLCKDALEIAANKLLDIPGKGISISYCRGVEGAGLIVNNFIYTKGNKLALEVWGNFNQYIIHNSILVKGNNAGAVYLERNERLQLKNNNFCNQGGGHVLSAIDLSFASDNNNLFTTGRFIAYYKKEITDLTAWKTITAMDLNSIAVNPGFITPTSAHITSSALNNLATPFSFVKQDIDGESRSNLPDIGADEFTPANFNAELVAFNQLALPCPGNTKIKIVLQNSGLLTLTGLSIDWQLNGILQGPYHWTGNLLPGAKTEINIGQYDLVPSVNYTIKAWCSQPNGNTDGWPHNDTLLLTNLTTTLSGNFTIGGVSPDFATIDEAVETLKTKGICAAVTFNIRKGYVSSKMVTISEIPGASLNNSITFQSETGINTDVSIRGIVMDGADYITIKNCRISPYGNGLIFQNGSDYNQVIGNDIKGSGSSCIYIDHSKALNNYNSYIGNNIEGCNQGILCNGKNQEYAIGTSIKNNRFTYQKYTGINFNWEDSIHIEGNVFEYVDYITESYSIGIHNCKRVIVLKNKINTSSSVGVSITDTKGLFANNTIHCSGTFPVTGLYVSAPEMKVYHNSVHITNTNIQSSALQFDSYFDSYNNVFVNAGGGYALKTNQSPYINPKMKQNNNNFYVTGKFGQIFNKDIPTLNDWKAATSLDSHSVFINPLFKSADDLHVREISLKNAGVDVTGIIADDMDGEARNLKRPDIGADEFTPITLDAAMHLIVLDPVVCMANIPIPVKIKNNGSTVLHDVRINWNVNSIKQPTYYWKGTLPSSVISDSIIIGSYQFIPGTDYALEVWVDLPNGGTDLLPGNDALSHEFLGTALSGMYTIGDTAADYANFSHAVQDLKLKGICGPVTFNVSKGTYKEQLLITEIPGASAINRITFQSASADSTSVILSYKASSESDNYTIHMNEADYISFRHITVKAEDIIYGGVVVFSGHTTQNQFHHNIFETAGNTNIINAIKGNNEYIEIINNVFKGGAIGIHFNPNWSTGTQYYASSNRIEKNAFYTWGSAISLSYQMTPVIASNTMLITKDNTQVNIALNASKKFAVTGNILIGGGISIQQCSEKSLIVNNFIQSNWNCGICISDSYSLEIYYNSVKVHNISINNKNSAVISLSGTTGISAYNNIFANAGEGLVYKMGSLNNLSFSDNNDLYYAGKALANIIYAGGYQHTLAAWQKTTGKDSNSISVPPMFYSDTDLHTANPFLQGKAIPLTWISSDIDGEIRHQQYPDIGADEFAGPQTAHDAGITGINGSGCGGNRPVYVTIGNYGADILKTATIHFSINDSLFKPYIWTGNLQTGQLEDSIHVSDFLPHGNNNLKAWTSGPNGFTDSITKNDTLSIYVSGIKLNGTYTIGGVSPDFKTLNEAVKALNNVGICGTVTFNIRPGTYAERLVLKTIEGASRTNKVIFQSENGDNTSVILTAPNGKDTSLLKLDAVSFVHFNKLSFTQDAATFSIINIEGYSNNIKFTNNIISSISSQLTLIGCPSVIGTASDTNYFIGNKFIGGKNGFSFTNISTITNIVIKNNTFTNQVSRAIYLYNMYSEITANEIYSISTEPFGGIVVMSGSIKSNKITINSGTGISTAPVGLTGSPFIAEIINNMITIGTGPRVSTGISVGTSTSNPISVDIYFNTVHIYNSLPESKALQIDNNAKVKNNIFSNVGGGYALKIFNNSEYFSDFNNLYTSGAYLIKYNDTQNITTINEWRNQTQQDINSLSVKPHFVSNTDLHLKGDSNLNARGIKINGISKDIDADRRKAIPDIGADEFSDVPKGADAGLVSIDSVKLVNCNGAYELSLRIKNEYPDTLKSVKVNIRLSSITQTPFLWSGNLKTDSISSRFKIACHAIALQDTFRVKVWTSDPNNLVDINNTNDTLVRWPFIHTKTLCEEVWPGDANNDHIVSNEDLLPIGLNFGISGSKRDSVSNTWMGHKCYNWNIKQNNGSDLKFTDCNGDGTINDLDTVAVHKNYGFKRNSDSVPIFNAADPDIYFTLPKNKYVAGEWVDAEINLGAIAKPVSDLYGLAFDVIFDPMLVEPGSMEIYYSGSWLGKTGGNILQLSRSFEQMGRIDGAIVKTDHMNSTGFGKIAALRFKTNKNMSIPSRFSLQISSCNAIDANGTVQPFNTIASDTFTVHPVISFIKQDEGTVDFSIYPNPYTDHTNISYELRQESQVMLEVYNAFGQIIESFASGKQQTGKYTYLFGSSKEYARGIYWVKLTVDGRVLRKKLIKLE